MRILCVVFLIAVAIAAFLVGRTTIEASADAAAKHTALQARYDSLETSVVSVKKAAAARERVLINSLQHVHDSILKALPVPRDLYLRHREEARHLPMSDKYRYMGILTVDSAGVHTTEPGHP